MMQYRIISLFLSVFIFQQTVFETVLALEDGEYHDGVEIIFQNELSEPVVIFYEGEHERIAQNEDEPLEAKGGRISIKSYPGDKFSYDFGGQRHYEVATHDEISLRVLLAGKNEIGVQCTVSAEEKLEVLNLRIIPWWAPFGASHFLSLVRSNYYDGAALNRNVPKFLTQFGISADYDTRTFHRSNTIRDDAPLPEPIRFKPGMLSYAGSGPDSRTTEIFVVAPRTSQSQLDHFGVNPWETPFGIIDFVEKTAVARWFSYGDMPPYGNGPDPQKIYRKDGYEYLKTEFPDLDYIEKCVVVEVDQNDVNEIEEEEL